MLTGVVFQSKSSHLSQLQMLKSYLQSNTNELITMNNNQDQFQKDMYQVPTSQTGEVFDSALDTVDTTLPEDEVNQSFEAIAREEILASFNVMTRNLELDSSNTDTQRMTQVEKPVQHPIIVELLQLSVALEAGRVEHHQALIERAEKMGLFARAYVRLFEKNSSQILNPTMNGIINAESQLGLKVFTYASGERDQDITHIHYFLHDGEWFHQQASPIAAKNFTNKYEITELGILKSSTYTNEHGVNVHKSAVIGETEAYNLLIASRKHIELVTTEIYGK